MRLTLSLSLLFAFCLAACQVTLPAQYTPAYNPPPEGETYEDGKGGTVYLPLGGAAFVDRAVSYTPGERSARGVHADPNQAIGTPDYTSPSAPGFISLGCDGSVELEFTDNVLLDVEGADLYIFEVGPRVEAAAIAVSDDGERWVEVGEIEGSRSAIDIGPFVAAGDVFSYVRLTNVGGTCSGRTPGADIDAVAAAGTGYRFSLPGNALFEPGEATLKDGADAEVARLADRIGQMGAAGLIVQGYAQPAQGAGLAEARAEALWEALAPQVRVDARSVIARAGPSSPSDRVEAGVVDVIVVPRSR